jgi:hypothetical protein
MKNIILVLTLIFSITLMSCNSKQEAKKHAEHTTTTQVIYYSCPMTEHSHSAAKEPGICDLCGMDMVAVIKVAEGENDFYGCPMAEHSHVRSDEPGTCADCGMTYRPLKFDM